MAKSFNEMAGVLKDLIVDANSDAHNSRSFKEERYSNMKISMDPSTNPKPHVTVQVGMSKATYDLSSGERLEGSLGPDERYISRWFSKMGVMDGLKELWKSAANADKEQMDLANKEEKKKKNKKF